MDLFRTGNDFLHLFLVGLLQFLFQSVYLCLFQPRIPKVRGTRSSDVIQCWNFLCRAFASILRCHRLKKKPIGSHAHRTSTTIDQIRVQKSHSCDITSGHLLETSESMTSNRTSCDSQRQFIPLTTQRRLLDHRQMSVFKHKAHSTTSKSLSTLTAPEMIR
jgi:hypothetical protein